MSQKVKKTVKSGPTEHLKSLGSKKTKYALGSVNSRVLETFENLRTENTANLMLVPFVMPNVEFTSLCPKTGQPDFARIEIVYVPMKKMVESKSLKLYLFSFRNHGGFHEECVNRIANDLWNLLKPAYLRVIGDFTPRGGIAIKPIVQRFIPADETDMTSDEIARARALMVDLVYQFDAKGLGL